MQFISLVCHFSTTCRQFTAAEVGSTTLTLSVRGLNSDKTKGGCPFDTVFLCTSVSTQVESCSTSHWSTIECFKAATDISTRVRMLRTATSTNSKHKVSPNPRVDGTLTVCCSHRIPVAHWYMLASTCVNVLFFVRIF